MAVSIDLTDQERSLRQLLLDVSKYIGEKTKYTEPVLRFTGGWVRDKLLDLTSKDIDVGISSMTGYNFGLCMKEFLVDSSVQTRYDQNVLGGLAKIAANPEKSKHLETVTTKILDLEIDLVNLRKETYLEDSRNPTMEFGSPEEDALRRDATVNALFYNLSTCQVEDFTGKGLDDMAKRIIRTPLAPYQTFKDDPLRILRCIRFASKLGYRIEPEAEQVMSDTRIKHALRAKISRERIGIEIEKMLKGPKPYTALGMIDRLGLYNTIFTDPKCQQNILANTDRWAQACDLLLGIIESSSESKQVADFTSSVKNLLLTDRESVFWAWILCALVPWARTEVPNPKKTSTRNMLPYASLVTREGLKTENRITNVVENAVMHLNEIIAHKNAFTDREVQTSMGQKRKPETLKREDIGMAIKRWGAQWRSSAVFALLVEAAESNLDQVPELTTQYALWLENIQKLDLGNAYSLKPLVNGNQLAAALGVKSGPWTKRALEIAMEWQFRNPEAILPEGGIAEVLERKGELGLP